MRRSQREALRVRFDSRCGYCGVREQDVGSELTVDHFQPLAYAGADNPANWVYACFMCNSYKGDTWAPDSPHRILHPLDDPLDEHIAESTDGTLLGLTGTGRFHIDQLQLNRSALVAYRRARRREKEIT